MIIIFAMTLQNVLQYEERVTIRPNHMLYQIIEKVNTYPVKFGTGAIDSMEFIRNLY